MNKISKMQKQHFSNYLKNHFIQNSEPNFLTPRQGQSQKKSHLIKPKSQNQNRNITKKKNNIFSNFNIYISPTNKRINGYYPQYSNRNQNKINYNEDIFDMRIYYCLKMLGLGSLQTIFENNNINFDELLILSLKDLANLGIPKNQQIIIKKFSIDYIKNASYYTLDELQKYFTNISNIYNNYNNSRTNHSERNLNKNMVVYKNNRIYNTNKNDYKNSNYANTNNNFENNRNNRYLINNMKSNQEYFRRSNSESSHNNKKCSLIKTNKNIINNNKNFNSINYDFNYNNKPQKKIGINRINNNYNISKSEGHYSSSNYNHSIMTNYEMKKNQNNIREEMLQKNHKYKTFNSEQSKKIRQLDDLSKKQINNILSKRIVSLQTNSNDYGKNMNYNNLINFRNEKELTMFLQMENMKKNIQLNNKKINNSNITNTKINNYINNFYNINKNSLENIGYNNKNNQNRNSIGGWRNNKKNNGKNMLNKNSFNQENLINNNIMNENLTIQNNNINNKNYMNQKYMNTNQNISKRRNIALPIDSINKNLYNRNMYNNNIGNKTQKNLDVKSMNIYNYYKSNYGVKNHPLNTINNVRTVNSIEVSHNNNYYNNLLNYNNYDLEEENYLNNNINKKLCTEIGFYRPNHFKDKIHHYQSKRFKIFEGQNYDNNYNMM